MGTPKTGTKRKAIVSLTLLLPLAGALGSCSMDHSAPTSPTRSVIRITPADGAIDVRLDTPVTLEFGTAVNRHTVESGVHLIADSDIDGGCPDSTMGHHASMDTIMRDHAMLEHMDRYHSTHGHYAWDRAGTTCTFVPDSSMRPRMRYMVHISSDMVHMMQLMGSHVMNGRMNTAGDLTTHFQTMSADAHSGHY